MTDHLSFDHLCDLHDGTLDAGAASAARQHLALCDSCAEQLSSLVMLENAASALPAAIAPPDDLWADIRAELGPKREVRRGFGGGRSVRHLAAAAVLIAVGSSVITVAMMRRSPHAPDQVAGSVETPQAPLHVPVALPASLASEESGFTRSIDVLQRSLDERRDSLAPSTVEIVERSLRVADAAIAEARDALARDPANRALARLFASNYERKIDLLKRATELAPRT
ncbi:MAG: hypothetical protein ABJA80_03365 [bacterium]